MGVEELVIRLRTVNELGGFDQLANRIQTIDSLMNKFSSKVSDISKSITAELSKINNIDFNNISNNFQSVFDKIGSDVQKASQIATSELSKINTVDFNRISSYSKAAAETATKELSKINTVDFNKLYNNFRSISDIIGRDSRTASQIATSELSKINIIDFNTISNKFKAATGQINNNARIAADSSVSLLQKINSLDFTGLSNKFKSVVSQMANDARSVADTSTSLLQRINTLDFSGLGNKFKSVVTQMANDARSVADTISSSFQNMSQGLDGMVAGLGGAVGMNKLFQESQQKAALGWRMNNLTTPEEAKKITGAYVQYDIGSSRADEDLTTMMNLLVGSGELTSKNTARSLGILDAISANADPLKQRGAMYGFGSYLSSGYEAAKGKLRDEGLTDSQLERMKAAKTYQERLDVLQQVALERGQLQIGQNGELVGLYNTMTGEIGGYNKALALLDRVVQAGTEAFMGFMDVLSPFFDFLSNLPEPVWDFIGVLTVAVGTGAIFLGGLSAIGTIIPFLTGGFGILVSVLGFVIPGFSGSAAAMSLSAVAAGKASVSFSLLGGAIRTMGASLLANPIFWIAAVIIGVAAAVIYLKTQTTLLSGTMEKAARSMNTLNNRLELLEGKEQAVAKQTEDLKAKLDTLDKSSAEYETVYKNYEDNKKKLEDIKREIEDINHIKGSVNVTIETAKLNTAHTRKELEKAYNGTGVTPHEYTSAGSIAQLEIANGELLHYNKLASTSYETLSKLNNQQKSTFEGKQFAQFTNDLQRINALETKALELANQGKELDWGEQLELSRLKTNTDKLAGILPTDSIEERVKKYEDYAKDANNVKFVPVEEALKQWFEGAGPYLEGAWRNTEKWFSSGAEWIQKGWNDFSKWFTDGAAKIGSDISKSWDGLVKWFDSGVKGIQEWFNGLPGWFQQQFQGLADWFSNLPSWLSSKVGDLWGWLKDSVKDIPVIGGLANSLDSIFDSLKSKDIGQMISDMITKTDWVSVGVTLSTSLWEGIKSVLMANPISKMLLEGADALTGGALLGNDKGATPPQGFSPLMRGLSLPEIKLPEFKWPNIPEFNWPMLPNFRWPTLPIFRWPKLPDFKWPKLPEFKWPKLPAFHWPKLPAFHWPNIGLPNFGAGSPGYVNTDFGKGDLYEGPSYDYSAISSDSFVDSSSSNSDNSMINSNNNTVHVTIEGNVDSDDRADDVATRVLSEMAFGLNKDNNANRR